MAAGNHRRVRGQRCAKLLCHGQDARHRLRLRDLPKVHDYGVECLDLCEKCADRVHVVEAAGAQGRNSYVFRKAVGERAATRLNGRAQDAAKRTPIRSLRATPANSGKTTRSASAMCARGAAAKSATTKFAAGKRRLVRANDNRRCCVHRARVRRGRDNHHCERRYSPLRVPNEPRAASSAARADGEDDG